MAKKFLFIIFIIFISTINFYTNASALNCNMTVMPEVNPENGENGIAPLEVFFTIDIDENNLSNFTAKWDYDDGETSTTPYPLSKKHTYKEAGIYNPVYKVDSYFGAFECSASIKVGQSLVNPEALLITTPQTGMAPLKVEFKPSFKNVEAIEYKYDFGDGTIESYSSNEVISHIYKDSGEYKASVTIIDANLNSYSKNVEILVLPFKVIISSDKTEGHSPLNVKFKAQIMSGQDSNDGMNPPDDGMNPPDDGNFFNVFSKF